VVGDPWLTRRLLVKHVKTISGSLDNSARRQDCSTTLARALGARANSDSGREGAEVITGGQVCWGAARGTAKPGCSHLHSEDLKTWLPACHDAEEPAQPLPPQGLSSPSVRAGLREPPALQHIPHSPQENIFPSLSLVFSQKQRQIQQSASSSSY